MSRNNAIEKVTHEEALENCVRLHTLDGFVRFGPIGLNLVGVIFFIVACAVRVLLYVYPISPYLILASDLSIPAATYYSLLPTVDPIWTRYSSYVKAVFRDENQVKATKLKQHRNFYGD